MEIRHVNFLQFMVITYRYATQTTFLSDLVSSAGLGLASSRIRNLKGVSCVQHEAMLTSQSMTLFPLNL